MGVVLIYHQINTCKYRRAIITSILILTTRGRCKAKQSKSIRAESNLKAMGGLQKNVIGMCISVIRKTLYNGNVGLKPLYLV